MNTKEILINARALIAHRENWIKHSMAANALGYTTSFDSSTACAFCSFGAVRKTCMRKSIQEYDSLDILNQLAVARGFTNIALFNDAPKTTHAEVIALFDEAITSL